MKIIVLALLGLLLCFGVAASAQVYIGGFLNGEVSGGLNPCDTCPVLDTCLPPEGNPGGLTTDGAYLCVAHYFGTARIYKIDPASCTVVRSIPAPGNSNAGLAWDGAYIRDVQEQAGLIYKLDPADGTVLHVIPAPSFGDPDPNAAGLAWDGSYLWHADYGHQLIYKLDPGDGTILAVFEAPGPGPSGVG